MRYSIDIDTLFYLIPKSSIIWKTYYKTIQFENVDLKFPTGNSTCSKNPFSAVGTCVQI